MSVAILPKHWENVHTWDDAITRINKLHVQTQNAALGAVESARLAGELLIEEKKKLGHGEWLPWLEKNVNFSERTARNYMRVAKVLPKLDREDRQRVADMSFRDCLGSLVTDTNRLSKLPEASLQVALEAANSQPLRTSVNRASTAERVRRQQERVTRIRDELPTATSVPVGPTFRLPAWRIELRDKIVDTLKQAMTVNDITITDAIEALQDAYCELQDGTLP